jgi:hypothetical protein
MFVGIFNPRLSVPVHISLAHFVIVLMRRLASIPTSSFKVKYPFQDLFDLWNKHP